MKLFREDGGLIDEFETATQEPGELLTLIGMSHPGREAFRCRVEDQDGHGFWMFVSDAPAI